MRSLHVVNAVLWCANSATWGLYAGNAKMAVASLAAAALAAYLAWSADTWDYR